MKEQLAQIFNALGEISTKGHDTFVMADARRMLAQIIDALPDPAREDPEKNTEEK